jgi:lysophospholipase L1-like esterase
MEKKNTKRYNFADYLIIGVILAISTYIFVGFFYVDPYSVARFGRKFIILVVWGSRIFFPLLVLLVVWLYHLVKIGKISTPNLILMAASVLLSLLVMYPFGEYIYKRFGGIQEKLHDFHPYLQLKPNDFKIETASERKHPTVFCLGGSTTEFKGRNGSGWPDRLGHILAGQDGLGDIAVHNLGRQWYTSLHTLINYEANLRQYKPDIIIVMHAINDLLHNADTSYFSHAPFREDYGHFYGPVNRLISTKNYIQETLDKVRFWYHEPRREILTDEFPGLIPFERYLNTLIDLAALDGTRVILMTQPYLIKPEMTPEEKERLKMLNVETYGPQTRWSHMTALYGMQQYNQAVADIARERGVTLIDLEKAIPKTLEYFYDDVHYTEKAYDVIAQFIAEEMIRQKILTVTRGTDDIENGAGVVE